MDLLLLFDSAGCARCVDISRPNQDVTAPAEGFQHVDYFPASSSRRYRAQAAQLTQLVDDLEHRRRFIVEDMFARKIKGALCNKAPPISQKNDEVVVTSVTLTQLWRLNGRAHAF